MGKYLHPQNCAFSDIFGPDLTRHVVALCMAIAICHRRKLGQVWGSPAPLPEVAGNLRCQKAPLWTFDYHTEKSESFCDVTPLGCRLVTGRYVLGVLYGENGPKSENLANLTLRSSATVRRTKKLSGLRKLPGPWTVQRGVNSISLQCIP